MGCPWDDPPMWGLTAQHIFTHPSVHSLIPSLPHALTASFICSFIHSALARGLQQARLPAPRK